MSKVVAKISRSIAGLRQKFVYFPTSYEKTEVSTGFQESCRFPGVIGAIDCTHVRIACPKADEAGMFYNRKGYYSLNCQFVCDHIMRLKTL